MDELLLDSTYLLPIFGIKLELQDFETTFTRLSENYIVRYSPASLIETKWAIIKRSRRLKEAERRLSFTNYRQGLLSLQRDPTLQSTPLTNEVIEDYSDLLLLQYHVQDYFDRQIYSTSVFLRCVLLTEDQAMHDLFRKTSAIVKDRPSRIIRWRDLQFR
jgi:PIN domain nuclease of toxin-antitoxin system